MAFGEVPRSSAVAAAATGTVDAAAVSTGEIARESTSAFPFVADTTCEGAGIPVDAAKVRCCDWGVVPVLLGVATREGVAPAAALTADVCCASDGSRESVRDWDVGVAEEGEEEEDERR